MSSNCQFSGVAKSKPLVHFTLLRISHNVTLLSHVNPRLKNHDYAESAWKIQTHETDATSIASLIPISTKIEPGGEHDGLWAACNIKAPALIRDILSLSLSLSNSTEQNIVGIQRVVTTLYFWFLVVTWCWREISCIYTWATWMNNIMYLPLYPGRT